MKFSKSISFMALLACITLSAQPQTQNSGHASSKSASAATKSTAFASAEVVEVYPRERRLLLKHGPIADLRMSAMTMEFAVRNPKLLNGLKPGNKIRFTAVQANDDYVVTSIEVTR